MKFSIVKSLMGIVAGLAVAVLSPCLHAAPSITGDILFVGGASLNGPLDTATAFTSIFGPLGTGDPMVRSGATGSYSGVAAGTQVSFSLFTFNPAPVTTFTLWSFSVGSTMFSFDATSVVVSAQNSSFLDLEGTGVAHITGFSDTPGTWSITDTGNSPVFTFGAQTTIVPEPSTAALLLVGGAALTFLRRASARA